MPTQVIRPGVILRRGAHKLTAAELKPLMDNPDEVDRIIKDINVRRDLFLRAESDATAALDKLGTAQKALSEDQDTLAEGEAALSVGRADAAKKHTADMEALGRRTMEVREKEAMQAERQAGLVAERAVISAAEAGIMRFRGRLDEAIGEFQIGAGNPSKPKER